MSSVQETSEPGRLHEDQKVAFWAWPVVLISVLFIGWLVNVLPVSEVSEEGAPVENLGSPADLALLQIHSQAIIASASADAAEGKKLLENTRKQTSGIRSRTALVLVEAFIDPRNAESSESLAELRAEDGAPDWLGLVEVAITEGVSDDQRESLREELGWFASLAAGPGNEEPEAAGEIRLRSAGVVVLILVCFLSGLIVILIGGVFLFVLYRKQKQTGRALKFQDQGIPRGVMLEAFALYLGVMALGEAGAIWIHGSLSLVGYGLSIVVPLSWPKIRGVCWKDFAGSIGLHRGEGWFKEIGCGILGYSGVLTMASMGIFVTWAMMIAGGLFAGEMTDTSAEPVAPETHPIVGWMFSGSMAERLFCLLLASVLAPLLEETFFRGALHRYLRGRMGFFVSALVTGLIFAALHPQGWMAIPALCSIGIGFSLLREWRDSLIAPMVAHAINNGALIVALWIAL